MQRMNARASIVKNTGIFVEPITPNSSGINCNYLEDICKSFLNDLNSENEVSYFVILAALEQVRISCQDLAAYCISQMYGTKLSNRG
jgi:hypothetical protein